MALNDLEKFIFYKGVLGCSLDKVPSDLLRQLDEANTLEIVDSSVTMRYPSSLKDLHFCMAGTYSLNKCMEYHRYVLKPKIDAWRSIVFLGKPLHSGLLAAFMSIIMQNPDGVDKKYVKSCVAGCEKNMSKWLRNLSEHNIIRVVSRSAEHETIFFNKDLIEDRNVTYLEKGNLNKTYKMIAKKNEKQMLDTLPGSSLKARNMEIQEVLEKAISAIKDHQHGIPVKSLKVWLSINDEEMVDLLEIISSMDGFQIIKNDNVPVKIIYKTMIDLSGISEDAKTFIIGICRTYRMFLLSEQPKELKTFKNSANISDEEFLKIMEKNQFTILEIRYKYMNSDYLIYRSDIDDNNEDLIDLLEKAKNKIARYFKVKVQNIFFRNSFLTTFDNHYTPFFKERMLVLYKFICQQMEKHAGLFFLNNNSILDINFYSFVRVVPLRLEFQFLEIISEIACLSSARMGKKYFEGLLCSELEVLNEECVLIAQKYTLGDVLSLLPDGSDSKNALLARVNILELDKILLSLAKYNIFEGFYSSKYIYFEAIQGIDGYIDRIFQTIIDEGNDSLNVYVPYGVRRMLYERIAEFSSEKFYSGTKDVIEEMFHGAEKEHYMKKLQSFE